jgi:hypothetical protein
VKRSTASQIAIRWVEEIGLLVSAEVWEKAGLGKRRWSNPKARFFVIGGRRR